jgi:dienelactone hydrolase
MPGIGRLIRAWTTVAVLLGLILPSLAASPGPQGGEGEPFRRQAWLIPSPQPGILMRADLFRPAGAGPFPLAVINHGSQEDADRRALAAMPSFPELTAWLVGRGYAVLIPERPGHGKTSGRYTESEGPCRAPDFRKAGEATADDIAAVLDFALKQKLFRPTRVLLLGNSAGGWGALALASRNPKTIAAVIAFAPGRGGRQHDLPRNNCAPDRLVAAAAHFGKTGRIPALWLYAKNDAYFPPSLADRLAAAYAGAGGRLEYHQLPAFGREGHVLVQAPAATWEAYLSRFLSKH